MKQTTFKYLVEIQYLGFRFHGWAKQKKVKTVHEVVDKTLSFALEHTQFKTLGAGRTDARVSANQTAFELFSEREVNTDTFLAAFNKNGPSDVKALSIRMVDDSFNIIQSSKIKEYQYLFAFGEKAHPFSSSLMATFLESLDIEKMKEGAKLFEGTHNFKKYCTKPSENTIFEREILKSEILENSEYQASFFPKKSYVYQVHGKGFMRYQIRLMMGQLVELGKGTLSLSDLKDSLQSPDDSTLRTIAPGSGLILNKVKFDDLNRD